MNLKEFLKLTEGGKIVFFIFLILGILLFVPALVCHEDYRPLTEEFIKLNPFITKPDIQGILVCSVTSLVWPTLLAPLYWYILSCLIILVYKKLREKIGRIKAIIAILILIFSAIIINGMYYYLSEYKTISNQKQTTKDYYQELADKCTDDCCAQSVKTMRENDYKQMPLEECPKDYQSNQLLCVSSYKWCEPKKEGESISKNGRNYCRQDSDCVLAPKYQGCCNNCNVKAVNVGTKNRDEEIRNKQYYCSLKKIACPQYKCPSSGSKQAVCEQNRCAVKEKQPANVNTDNSNFKIIGSFSSPGESSFVKKSILKSTGSIVYLTDISEGLLAIDVSNPEKPTLLSKIKIDGGGAYTLAMHPSGLYAVVSGYGNSKIALIEIRDPKKLQIIDEIDAKRPVQDMVTVANNVYLSIDGPEVEVLGLKPPTSDMESSKPSFVPGHVFQIQGGGHAIGLAVLDINYGDLLTHNLIIAQGESGVGVYKKAEFTLQLSFVSNVGYVNIVVVDEKYIYAGVGNGIKVIDLKTQKEITDIKVDDVWGLKVKNNTLYVASGENGVKVLDISDIRNPKEIAVIDTPGRARSIDISEDGKYIYVADDRDDLQIIKVE